MVKASDVPSVTFSNGIKIPIIGLGTWKSAPGAVKAAVESAIDAGYRHLDCAWIYGNEKEIGEALKSKMGDGTIKREDIFITTKIWNTYRTKELVNQCINESLEALGVEYVDLLLMHWPHAYKEGTDKFPGDADGKRLWGVTPFTDTWMFMEEVAKEGKCKSLGVSNFNSKQIQKILDVATIKPVVNQVECHPWLVQSKLLEFCKGKDIVLEAYSPLGSPDRPWATPDAPILMEDPALKEIAEKKGKSVAQICIRFQVQRGVVVLPKSVTPSRIESNLSVLDFELTDEEMAAIVKMDKGEEGRACSLRWVDADHPDYPFNEEF